MDAEGPVAIVVASTVESSAIPPPELEEPASPALSPPSAMLEPPALPTTTATTMPTPTLASRGSASDFNDSSAITSLSPSPSSTAVAGSEPAAGAPAENVSGSKSKRAPAKRKPTKRPRNYTPVIDPLLAKQLGLPLLASGQISRDSNKSRQRARAAGKLIKRKKSSPTSPPEGATLDQQTPVSSIIAGATDVANDDDADADANANGTNAIATTLSAAVALHSSANGDTPEPPVPKPKKKRLGKRRKTEAQAEASGAWTGTTAAGTNTVMMAGSGSGSAGAGVSAGGDPTRSGSVPVNAHAHAQPPPPPPRKKKRRTSAAAMSSSSSSARAATTSLSSAAPATVQTGCKPGGRRSWCRVWNRKKTLFGEMKVCTWATESKISRPTLAGPSVRCSVCSAEVADAAALNTHMQKDHLDPRTVCGIGGCDKRFQDHSRLKKHQSLHSAHLPWVCSHPGCDRRFAVQFVLNLHQLSHGASDSLSVIPTPASASASVSAVASPFGSVADGNDGTAASGSPEFRAASASKKRSENSVSTSLCSPSVSSLSLSSSLHPLPPPPFFGVYNALTCTLPSGVSSRTPTTSGPHMYTIGGGGCAVRDTDVSAAVVTTEMSSSRLQHPATFVLPDATTRR